MNWLSDHFWLLLASVCGTAFVFVIFLFQRLFSNHTDDTDAVNVAVRASELNESRTNGSQATQPKQPSTEMYKDPKVDSEADKESADFKENGNVPPPPELLSDLQS